MIIAIDFDGVLCYNAFPRIGKENPRMIEFVRELIEGGHEIILWTSRVDERLEEALTWCRDRGLEFCAVNENSPSNRAQYEVQHPNGTRKVFADLYLDDHTPQFWWDMKYLGYNHAIDNLIYLTRKAVGSNDIK